MDRFRKYLEKNVLICDGAMGSMVAKSFPHASPIALARSLLEVNLTDPHIVQDVHLSYVAAGAQCIFTMKMFAGRFSSG